LIRAELNLIGIVRRKEQQKEEAWQTKRRMDAERGTPFDLLVGKIDTFAHILRNPLTPAASSANMCTFEDTFATIFYWRCRDLIPEAVRSLRADIVPSIVETAHALTISRLVARAVMQRRILKASKKKAKHRCRDAGVLTTSLVLWQTEHADVQQQDAGRKLSVHARSGEWEGGVEIF